MVEYPREVGQATAGLLGNEGHEESPGSTGQEAG